MTGHHLAIWGIGFDFSRLVDVDVGNHHFGSFSCKAEADRAAEVGGASGDDDHSIGECEVHAT